MADVFISYHTKSASFIARQIVETLENNGISCWYAPRNVEEGAFARSITNAIDQCKVFVLILNEEANHSEHVLNEVNYAFARFQSKKMSYIPLRINGAPMCKELKYYLGRIQMVEARWLNNTLQLQELVPRILKILGTQPPVPKVKPPLYDEVYISDYGKSWQNTGQRTAQMAHKKLLDGLYKQLLMSSSPSFLEETKNQIRQETYQLDVTAIARRILFFCD